jgi:asparagine synthase (glutamine-hydrolysing)
MQQSIPALLHYEDRNSMAFSIEARVPFLDHRIVEFALRLDDNYKIHGSWTKWVLRKSAERVVPRKVAWRRSKLGYPTPFARWLREEPNRSLFHELLFSPSFLSREIVQHDSLRFYWNQHQIGRVDRSWLLYRYASIELWFRQYIDGWEPNPAKICSLTRETDEPIRRGC